jgi:hypothetical protein
MTSIFAELMGAIHAIEISEAKGWSNIWLETDSKLVQRAFNSSSIVPWEISNRSQNCISITRSMTFLVTQIILVIVSMLSAGVMSLHLKLFMNFIVTNLVFLSLDLGKL